jgi:hypothetical protein
MLEAKKLQSQLDTEGVTIRDSGFNFNTGKLYTRLSIEGPSFLFAVPRSTEPCGGKERQCLHK